MSVHPIVTDEAPDRFVFRPLAALLVRGLVRTPVTPNQLTVAAALCGVGAGVAAGLRAPGAFASLLALMLTLDCADGQLARLRGGGDVWGRIADGIGDYVTALAMHVGLIVWVATDVGTLPAALWFVAAGLSMAWSAFLMDKYKRRFRGNVDDLESVRKEHDRSRGLKRWFVAAFLRYASGARGGARIPDRAAYRERTRWAMIAWLWLGPTMHYVLAGVLTTLAHPLLYAQITAVGLTALTGLALAYQRWVQARPPAVVDRDEPLGAHTPTT